MVMLDFDFVKEDRLLRPDELKALRSRYKFLLSELALLVRPEDRLLVRCYEAEVRRIWGALHWAVEKAVALYGRDYVEELGTRAVVDEGSRRPGPTPPSARTLPRTKRSLRLVPPPSSRE